jgi:hypothetical protein
VNIYVFALTKGDDFHWADASPSIEYLRSGQLWRENTLYLIQFFHARLQWRDFSILLNFSIVKVWKYFHVDLKLYTAELKMNFVTDFF